MDLYFKDPNARRKKIYKNWRSLNFTRNMGKGGAINIQLDYSPNADEIDTGWGVELWDNKHRVFNGMIYKAQDEDEHTVSLSGLDLAGMVDRRLIYQVPNFSQEASSDVVEKMDGLEILRGQTLKADNFIEVTGKEEAWHGENISLGKYLNDIGEKSVNLALENFPYNWWVDPNYNVLFQEYGNTQRWNDLPFTKITRTKDLTNTYNYVTVKGLPLYTVPYNRDFWTEYAPAEAWGFSGSSYTYATTQAPRKIGAASMGVTPPSATGSLSSVINMTYQGEYFNMENMVGMSYWVYHPTNTITGAGMQIYDSSVTQRSRWTSGLSLASATWHEIDFDWDTFDSQAGGNPDLTQVWLTGAIITLSGSSSSEYYLDNLHLRFNPYSYTSSDQTSIDKHGRFDKTVIAKEFVSNAECQTLADDLLEKYKDAKEVYNLSMNGFYDIYPNSMVNFKYRGVNKSRAVKSVTFYLTQEGTQSMQVAVADPLYSSQTDELYKKFAEINRNAYLEANPYRIG